MNDTTTELLSTETNLSSSEFRQSMSYKKWKVARFFTLYCDSPTEPEEISEETVQEFEKIFK